MSEIGKVLTGDAKALKGGGPVKALFIQNTNPVNVAPEQGLTRAGFAREDLFTVVHEQFMTDTAQMADIVLPATMFLEHNDYYRRGGHTRVLYRPQAGRGAGRMPLQLRGRQRPAAPPRHRPRLDAPDRPRDGGRDLPPLRASASSTRSRRPASSRAGSRRRVRISPTASPGPTAATASPRTGRAWSSRGLQLGLRSRRDAALCRPLGRHRADRRRHPVPPRHQPGARFPQLELFRNRGQPEAPPRAVL